jgi:hypothetical protein
MTALISRMVPLLNKLVPAGLALRGLSKISPQLANFATTSLSAGYGADQILDYLRDRTAAPGDLNESERLKKGEESGSLRPDEKRSLAKRKQNEVGKTIASAGIGLATGLAGMGGGEPQQIQGTPQQPTSQPQQVQPPPSPKKMSVGDQEEQRYQQYYGQKQNNQTDAAIMEVLNKILTM